MTFDLAQVKLSQKGKVFTVLLKFLIRMKIWRFCLSANNMIYCDVVKSKQHILQKSISSV